MFFDPNMFGIHKKASVSQCWLAATNPKLFKNFLLRGKMDEIGVPTLCDEVRVELSARLRNSTQGVPLYFAAQLVYGVVRIYQQQVEMLYEQTKYLIFYYNATMRELMLKRRRSSDGIHQVKKQKLPLDLAEDAKQYETDLPDTQGEDVCELLRHDSQAGNPRDFLIQEEVADNIIISDDDEDFGAIGGVEMLNLLNALKSDEDQSNEDMFPINKKKKAGDKNKNNLNEDSRMQNLADQEVDLIREAVREEEEMPLRIAIDDTPDLYNSIDINERTFENVSSFDLQPLLIENMEPGGAQAIEAVVPDQPEPLEDLTLVELMRQKRRRKSKFKVDKCIKISYNNFLKQFDYIKTLRCFSPRMDIVPPYRMIWKDSNRLFNMSASNLGSKKLLKAFSRNLKMKVTEVDGKILDDILGIESANFEAVQPAIRRNSRRPASCRPNDLNRTNESLATVLPPFEVSNALEVTTNALEISGAPDRIHVNSLLNEPQNCVDDRFYLLLKEELLKDGEGEIGRQKDSNHCNSVELNRSQLRKVLVIRRLLHLWKNQVEAVTMKSLCEGIQRKDAAFTFHYLLELRARQYIELKRDTETNEITNIEMGVKVLDRVNGTFKQTKCCSNK